MILLYLQRVINSKPCHGQQFYLTSCQSSHALEPWFFASAFENQFSGEARPEGDTLVLCGNFADIIRLVVGLV